MRQVVVFDFDGTLTQKDTMIEFVAFVRGRIRMLFILASCLPQIVMMKLGFLSNDSVKSLFLSKAIGGISRSELTQYGISFVSRIESILRKDTITLLEQHISAGDVVYVVSASAEVWIRPWCTLHGLKDVICTRLEYDENNKFSGRLSGKNCYGQEKVNRLLELEPNRSSYLLIAYGDSQGDKEMISFADRGIWV